jgi:pyruvate dehydrogenase E2 component (dihydrolipoamide acetyltransferase)
MTSTDFLLPQLPFGNAEVSIVCWLKRCGDTVAVGEPLVVVVNDRVEAALPATNSGKLERILAAEGAAVVAGAPLATIVADMLADVDDLPEAGASTIRISPVARRIADSEKLAITGLHGTGVSGRIMKSDVLAALVTPLSEAPLVDDREGRADDGVLRHGAVTSSSVTRHSLPIPYILTAIDVDLERIALLIAQHGPSFARRGMELSYRVCVALAVVAALPSHSLLNSYWADTMVVTRRRVHISTVPRAGAPPAFVRDAQDLNLRGLARAFGGAAAEHSFQDCTFVIADLGDQLWGDPSVLARNTAAALGLGAVRTRPLVIDDAGGTDRLAVRHVALLTLAYDARVFSQPYADAFLRDVKSRLERFHF